MKRVLGIIVFTYLSLNVASASEVDGRWYFSEGQCVSATGEVKQEPARSDESMVFDLAGENGSGIAVIHDGSELCKMDVAVTSSTHTGADGTQRIVISRQVRNDYPRGCSTRLMSGKSVFEYGYKQEDGILVLSETRPNSFACRTYVNYLNRDPICARASRRIGSPPITSLSSKSQPGSTDWNS